MNRKNTARLVRGWALRAGAVLIVLAGLTGTLAGPAYAVGKLYYVPADGQIHVVDHQCVQLGDPDALGNTGVHCADLLVRGHTDGKFYDVWGHNQLFCKNIGNNQVACAGIQETAALYNPTGRLRSASGICGTVLGHTACPAERVQNPTPVFSDFQVPNEFWGASINDTITLPGTGTKVTGPGLGTPHWSLITQASQ